MNPLTEQEWENVHATAALNQASAGVCNNAPMLSLRDIAGMIEGEHTAFRYSSVRSYDRPAHTPQDEVELNAAFACAATEVALAQLKRSLP